MSNTIRFAYSDTETNHSAGSSLPYLPLTLHRDSHSLTASGLLDTGSTVNVLPYPVGLQLGLIWDQQTTPVSLTGNLAKLPARGVIVSAQVASLPSAELVFAWTRSADVPLILGQVNFFMEFDVCFFRSKGCFEISPKNHSH